MKLYFSPGACSLASHLILHELGIKFETVQVNLREHKWSGGDFYKINPKGSVPTLQLDNGQILTEGPVILQYLADQKPEAQLIPLAGNFERYRCQEWLNFITSELHKGFSPLFDSQTPEDAKLKSRETLIKKLSFVSSHLATNDFLMGHRYSVADAYLFTILNWTKMVKMDLTTLPPLLGFMERVKTRPATSATMKAEGLLK